MNIENEEFFHIHRFRINGDNWKKGETIVFKNKLNYFTEYYDAVKIGHDDGESFLYTRNALHRFINGNNEYRNKEINNIFNLCNSAINELTTLIRELIFEEIRKISFPELPSRKSCIWVCDKQSVKQWWKKLDGNKKILRLSLTGTMHVGSEEYLSNDTFPLELFRQNALNYWQGKNSNNIESQEILFEGYLKILEVINSIDDFFITDLVDD